MVSDFYKFRKIIQDIIEGSINGNIAEDVFEECADSVDKYLQSKKIKEYAIEQDRQFRKIVLVFGKEISDKDKEGLINSVANTLATAVLNNLSEEDKSPEIVSFLQNDNTFDHYTIGDSITIQL